MYTYDSPIISLIHYAYDMRLRRVYYYIILHYVYYNANFQHLQICGENNCKSAKMKAMENIKVAMITYTA